MEEQTVVKNENIKEKPYLKYKDILLAKNKSGLFVAILSILIILSMLLLPILKSSYTAKLSDIDDLGTYLETISELSAEEVLKGEYTKEENFSIVDELVKAIKNFSSDEKSIPTAMAFEFILFPAFTVIMGFSIICMMIKQIYDGATYYGDIEKSTILSYDLIKKRGEEKEKNNIFKKQNVYSFLVFFAFSIGYGYVFGKILSGEEVSLIRYNTTYFSGLKGVNWTVAIPIILFVIYSVVAIKNKSIRDKLEREIVSEEYELNK